MRPGIPHRIIAVCSASVMLALQGRAQDTARSDTLALRALNRTFHLLPIDLSMDLSRGVLNDSVPGLRAIGAGYDNAIYGRYQRGDSVRFSLSFRRDSAGGLFGGYLTRRARVETDERTRSPGQLRASHEGSPHGIRFCVRRCRGPTELHDSPAHRVDVSQPTRRHPATKLESNRRCRRLRRAVDRETTPARKTNL